MSRIMARALTLAVISAAAQQARGTASRTLPRPFGTSRPTPAFMATSPSALHNSYTAQRTWTGQRQRSTSRVAPRVGAFVGALPTGEGSRSGGSVPKRSGVFMSSSATSVPHLSVADLTLTVESKVQLNVVHADKAGSWEGDLLVLSAFQQADKEAFATLAGLGAAAANEMLGGAAQDAIDTQEFKGEKKSSAMSTLGFKGPVKRLAIVGLGKNEDSALTSAALEAVGLQVAALAKSSKCKTMGVVLPEGWSGGAAQSLAQGVLIGLYTDSRYKSGKDAQKPAPLTAIDIIGGEGSEGLNAAKAVSSGVRLCRDLVNSPSNILTPGSLADVAVQIAKEHGLEAEILEVH